MMTFASIDYTNKYTNKVSIKVMHKVIRFVYQKINNSTVNLQISAC